MRKRYAPSILPGMLLAAMWWLAACSGIEERPDREGFSEQGRGVFILNEGNYNSGNASLSYYNPQTKQVQNGIFLRANDRKLGDTGQSITLRNGTAFIAVENSGIIWGIDAETFQVKGQLTSPQTEHMINPRYIHFLSDQKAYATDLYSPYITIFNPSNFQYLGSISTGQPTLYGYCSTEQMVECGGLVFTNCWCYTDLILAIDPAQDEVVDSIHLRTSMQPKSMVRDRQDRLWVITDGGYEMQDDAFGENIPHLYCIDPRTRSILSDQALDTDEGNVQLATNQQADTLYVINNDIYRMAINESHLPVRPFIQAPRDSKGRRHKLYGLSVDPQSGDLYVADAVDYAQSGVIYRYDSAGHLLDTFRVGINPNGFAFK